jgi:hypothetical protein
MKRLLVVMMAVLFLAGCGAAAKESGFYEHNTMYKSWDHMKFSMFGYKQVNPVVVKESTDEDWWGLTVK